jgi:hypothetical protein
MIEDMNVPLRATGLGLLDFAAGLVRQIAHRYGGNPKVELYMARVRKEDGEIVFERIGGADLTQSG